MSTDKLSTYSNEYGQAEILGLYVSYKLFYNHEEAYKEYRFYEPVDFVRTHYSIKEKADLEHIFNTFIEKLERAGRNIDDVMGVYLFNTTQGNYEVDLEIEESVEVQFQDKVVQILIGFSNAKVLYGINRIDEFIFTYYDYTCYHYSFYNNIIISKISNKTEY